MKKIIGSEHCQHFALKVVGNELDKNGQYDTILFRVVDIVLFYKIPVLVI